MNKSADGSSSVGQVIRCLGGEVGMNFGGREVAGAQEAGVWRWISRLKAYLP